ncbi:serine/threonine-protein kinase [Paenarthrobacter nitroguajacolicus]|uniref:serine/threonine-protein kinase n=1 Tax=Paenarthrobacter nitroguajacolicus TaxID=211146 RepID=UPI000B8A18E8|nr:serine/threonine-protein kinase [Paenarthrobacter nitroguajacolicus]
MGAVDVPFSDAEVAAAFDGWNLVTPAVGKGGFKVAYRADRGADPEVVKVLLEPFDGEPDDFDITEFSERLSRELNAMSSTNCPYIVKVTADAQVMKIGTQLFVWYAEPFYSGGTLEERLRTGPLEVKEVLLLARALFTAVEAMWSEHRIVHRDIKPGNIVFDQVGNPVLLDLGIALYGNLTNITNSFEYSPRTARYAAPEQFELRKDAQIDFRTDHFLVGMVIYEALTGKHPFWSPGVTMATYLDRMSTFGPAQFESIDCPAELRILVTRLLSEKVNRRYRRVEEPLADLSKIS